MPRKPLPENQRSAHLTITIDKDVYDKIKKYSEIELIPISRYIARILKRYFEMK